MQFLRCLKFWFPDPVWQINCLLNFINPSRNDCHMFLWGLDTFDWPGVGYYYEIYFSVIFPYWKKNSQSISLSLYVICPHAKYHMLSQILFLYMVYASMSYFICHMVYNIYLSKSTLWTQGIQIDNSNSSINTVQIKYKKYKMFTVL